MPWFRILPLLAVLAVPAAGEEDDFASRRSRFRQKLAAESLDRRGSAARELDLLDPSSVPLLYEMLAEGHWFVRGSGVRALSGVEEPAVRARLRLDLVTHENAMVREGVAEALGLEPMEGDAKALTGALEDEHWTVRRSTARSLGEIVSREGIVELIERLDRQEHPRVRTWAAWSLRTITGQKTLGQDQRRWRAWWQAHRNDPALEPLKGDAEVVRRKLAGIRLETMTVTRGPDPRFDLFVLSEYSYRDDYLRPYLDELSSRVRVTYIRLPTLRELTGVPGFEGQGPIPRYPVDKLMRAFDALRKEMRKDKVAILAHGATGWIALRFAQRYPKRTTALVLVNSWLDALSYTAALFNMLNHGNAAEQFVAESLTNQNSIPKSPKAHDVITRILLTSSFTDPADLDAARMWWGSYEQQGFSVVPDLRFSRGMELETPTLFYFSKDHPLSGHLSLVRLRKHVPNNVVAIMRRSRGHPYIEEPDEFLRVFDGFLAHFKL